MKNTMKYITIKDDGKLKTSEIVELCRKQFKVWSYYDNDKLDKDFPPATSSRKFRYSQEPDENLKNMSANDLKEKGIEGITLRERLLYELLYVKKEKKHLDVENITLCSGSRRSDGHVPYVGWNADDGVLSVYWYCPRLAYGVLRSRAVVSKSSNLEPEPLETLPLELTINGIKYLRQ